MTKRILLCITMSCIWATALFSQTNVTITIDDVPNTRMFQEKKFKSVLLTTLDSLQIPVTIFINEGLIYKTDSVKANVTLLNNWVKRNYVTVGNHTFAHSRYSVEEVRSFALDIKRGEYITRELVKKHQKPLKYFRFPYNDLGKDSAQHTQIDSVLLSLNYISTPFTVESSDWMYNYVYEYYLQKGDFKKASEIGKLYVTKTLELFRFFDSLSVTKYGRRVNQIYLCHDNSLNATYLLAIIKGLKKLNYSFVSLDATIEDSVYHTKYNYYRKWGVSWLYRYMPTQKERVKWMKKEPSTHYIEALYTKLTTQK